MPTQNFNLEATDLDILKQAKCANGNSSDSAALRRIMREWALTFLPAHPPKSKRKSALASSQPCGGHVLADKAATGEGIKKASVTAGQWRRDKRHAHSLPRKGHTMKREAHSISIELDQFGKMIVKINRWSGQMKVNNRKKHKPLEFTDWGQRQYHPTPASFARVIRYFQFRQSAQ